MNNINITFENPWLLLLIIPAIVLALIPYFRLKKKRRRTRNRITSLVLHALIIICSVLVISGLDISKTEQVNSEIVILKDQSLSTNDVRKQIDDYVVEIVDETNNDSKIGVVAFGYGECAYSELARPRDIDLDSFNNTIKCDTTATDIENAIGVATNLFDKNSDAYKRIILLTDAIETDGNVSKVIDNLVKNGVKVDAIVFEPTDYTTTKELQIDNVNVPTSALPNEEINISVVVSAHLSSSARIKISDNGEDIDLDSSKEILNLKEGSQTFEFTYKVIEDGIHLFKVEIESDDDLVAENNVYYAYCFVDGDQKILIIADNNQNTTGIVGQINVLGYGYKITAPDNIGNMNSVDLAEYGEVILMNVDARTLPFGFEDEIEEYVVNGGSLLTTGGEQTYALGGFEGTTFEEMLPVEVVPKANNPRAIVICLDISNSMFMNTPETKDVYSKNNFPMNGAEGTCIDVAKKSIIETVENGLNPYDYLGIVVYARNKEGINHTKTILELTPATNQNKISEKVLSISRTDREGSTDFDQALIDSKNMLDAFTGEVNHKSVVFITDDDGENNDSKTFVTTISAMVNPEQAKDKIDFSAIVLADNISSDVLQMGEIDGVGMENIHQVHTTSEFANIIFDLCKSLPSSEYNYVNGVITDLSVEKGSPITKGFETFPEIEEYNGVSAKTGAEVPIEYHNTNTVQDEDGEYVQLDNHDPIYAQWDYGKGKVGASMIDFSGVACPQLFVKDEGKMFVNNVITTLFSKEDLLSSIGADFTNLNYKTEMTVSFSGSDGTVISANAEIVNPDGNSGNLNSFAQVGMDFDGEFETKQAGLYEITVTKTTEKEIDGQKVTTTSESTVYMTFSYSKEYDTFYDMQKALANLGEVCDKTGGTIYHSADDIASNIAEMSQVEVDLNPQIWLMILALILFLLDICVRKFNFLWPHEIINNYKQKKAK